MGKAKGSPYAYNDSTELFKAKYYNIDSKGKNLLKVELSIDPHSSYITKVREYYKEGPKEYSNPYQ